MPWFLLRQPNDPIRISIATFVFLTLRARRPLLFHRKAPRDEATGRRLWLCHSPNWRGSRSDEELRNVPPFREVCPRLEERAHHASWQVYRLYRKDTTSVLKLQGVEMNFVVGKCKMMD